MGVLECRDCGENVSDRAPACPRCGGPMAAPVNGGAGENRLLSALKWGGGIFATAWLLSLCTDGGGGTKGAPAAKASAGMTESRALLLCQEAFKRLAKDPEGARVPYVANQGDGREFYFAWGAQTTMMRMRNGLGLEVAVSGSCIVDAASGRITSLTMDKKSIL